MARRHLTFALALAAAPACLANNGDPSERGRDTGVPDAGFDLAAGEAVFTSALADGKNQYRFACATCHALSEPAPDGRRRPAHPLGDVTRRPSWHNGQVTSLLDAVNACIADWIGAPAWTEDEPRWKELRAFLESKAPAADAPALVTTRAPVPANLAPGDGTRGRETFDRTCSVCHGLGGTGASTAPLLFHAFHAADATYIAGRVRNSGPASSTVHHGLAGGVMPFWAADRLNDDELRDVIGFLIN